MFTRLLTLAVLIIALAVLVAQPAIAGDKHTTPKVVIKNKIVKTKNVKNVKKKTSSLALKGKAKKKSALPKKPAVKSPKKTPVPQKTVCQQIGDVRGSFAKKPVELAAFDSGKELLFCGYQSPERGPRKFSEGNVVVRDIRTDQVQCLATIGSLENMQVGGNPNAIALSVTGTDDYDLSFKVEGDDVRVYKKLTTPVESVSDQELETIRLHGIEMYEGFAEEEAALVKKSEEQLGSNHALDERIRRKSADLTVRMYAFSRRLGIAARNGSAEAIEILKIRDDPNHPRHKSTLGDDAAYQYDRTKNFLAEKQLRAAGADPVRAIESRCEK